MKVANLVLTTAPGGVKQAFIDYCIAIKSLGHDLLAIINCDSDYGTELTELGIKFVTLKNRYGEFDLVATAALKKILLEHKIEAIFAHVGRSMILAKRAAKKIRPKILPQNISVIAVNHSNNIKRSLGADIILSVNKKNFYKTVDAGQEAQKSFVVANAISLDGASEPYQLQLRNKTKIVIGVMGELTANKGFDRVISALKILNSTGNGYTLKIAGVGKEESRLKKLAEGVPVEFCGFVTDKKNFFESIDIFCLSSFSETFALVLLEAMKYRRPIVATACEGPSEIIADGVDGILVEIEPKTTLSNRLAVAINKIRSDDELANFLVKNAYQKLAAKFSYESLKKHLREIIGEVK